MIDIRSASVDDTSILRELAETTFLESHGHSANPEEIASYVLEKYNYDAIKAELEDAANSYHIIFVNNEPAGFSKIILNKPFAESNIENLTKLDRIYILKRYYDLHVGSALYDFILDFIKKHQQKGIWLFVWKENPRAVNFYQRKGFKIIGSHNFRISEHHSNPNHQMLLFI